MKDNPIFVLTAGRSGSTLLQKLLNSNPGLVIWGEHMGILRFFSLALESVEDSPWINESAHGSWMLEADRELKADRWSAWDGPFSEQYFRERLKAFVGDLFCSNVPDETRWGFKELRYRKIEHVDFLMGLFPDAQILLLHRHPVDTCASHAAGALDKDSCSSCEITPEEIVKDLALSRIRDYIQFSIEVLEKYRGNSRIVRYEDIVESPEQTMAGIRDFLQLPMPFDGEKLRQVLSFDLVSHRQRRSTAEMDELRRLARIYLAPEHCWYESL